MIRRSASALSARALALLALTAMLAPTAASGAEGDPPPWLQPFNPDTQATLAAARAAGESGSFGLILYEHMGVSFLPDGAKERVYRVVARVDTPEGVPALGGFRGQWQRWRTKGLDVRARSISPTGQVRELDPDSLISRALGNAGGEVYSDARLTEGPIPGVTVGAVIETQVLKRESAIFPGVASEARLEVGWPIPVVRTLVEVDAPADAKLGHRLVNIQGAPTLSETGGRKRLTLKLGRLEAVKPQGAFGDPATSHVGYVEASLIPSWKQVATSYHGVVQGSLAGGSAPIDALIAGLQGVPAGRAAILLAMRIHERVRYTGLELGIAAVVPAQLAQTLGRGFGDCKDLATLYVAGMRALGHRAHVAILHAGPGYDLVGELPSAESFSHAIAVVNPGSEAIWTDLTVPFLPAGQLPAGSQGRRALIASPDTTGVITTPTLDADANTIVQVMEYDVTQLGRSVVLVRAEMRGLLAGLNREAVAQGGEAAWRADLAERMKGVLNARRVVDVKPHDLKDLTKPFSLSLRVEGVATALGGPIDAFATMNDWFVFDNLPVALRTPPDSEAPKEVLVTPLPHSSTLKFVLRGPPSFSADPLPADRSVPFGPGHYRQTSRVLPDGSIELVSGFHTGSGRWAPEQVTQTREALQRESRQPLLRLSMQHPGRALLQAGRRSEGLALFRRDAEAALDDPRAQAAWAGALLESRFAFAARAPMAQAISILPDNATLRLLSAKLQVINDMGAPMKAGFGRRAAIADLRRARALDTAVGDVEFLLALLLEMGDDGLRFTSGSDPDAALGVWRDLQRRTGDHSRSPAIRRILLFQERWAELRAQAATQPSDIEAGYQGIAAVTMTQGAQTALRWAVAHVPNREQRRQAIEAACTILAQKAHYRQARELAFIAALPAETRAQFDKLRPCEEGLQDLHPAERVGRLLLGAFNQAIRGEEAAAEQIRSLTSPDAWALVERQGAEEVWPADALWYSSFGGPLRSDVRRDHACRGTAATVAPTADGDHHLVRFTEGYFQGLSLTATRLQGEWRVVSWASRSDLLAREALRLMKLGDLRAARGVLARQFSSRPRATSGPPLEGLARDAAWRPADRQGAAELRLVAATLLAGWTAADALDARAIAKAIRPTDLATDDHRLVLQRLLALCADRAGDYDEAVRLYDGLLLEWPASPLVNSGKTFALLRGGRFKEAERFVRDRMASSAADRSVRLMSLYTLAAIAQRAGRHEDAIESLTKLRASGEKLNPKRLNSFVWWHLIVGRPEEAADLSVELERRSKSLSTGALHTIVAAYAAAGRTDAAWRVWGRLVKERPAGPKEHDWYVLGLLAEAHGLSRVARDAYERMPKPDKAGPGSSYALARKRLAALADAGHGR